MYGVLIGDMAGFPFKGEEEAKRGDFALFSGQTFLSEDSVGMAAAEETLLALGREAWPEGLAKEMVQRLKNWGRRRIGRDCENRFFHWLNSEQPHPYGAFDNGALTRAVPAAWFYDDLFTVRRSAAALSMITHSHPEGVRGAEAVASAVFLLRNGADKMSVKSYVESNFGYDLGRSLQKIRAGYCLEESCQNSVGEAMICFLSAASFEEAVRNAISLGGDAPTLAAVAGALAESYFGIPGELIRECRSRLPKELAHLAARFYRYVNEIVHIPAVTASPGGLFYSKSERLPDPEKLLEKRRGFLEGNELLEDMAAIIKSADTDENLRRLAVLLRERLHDQGHLIVPVIDALKEAEEKGALASLTLQRVRISGQKNGNGEWFVAFTSRDEFAKSAPSQVITCPIGWLFERVLKSRADGLILNPWGSNVLLKREILSGVLLAEESLQRPGYKM